MSAQPHPVAVADPAQWLRAFALRYSGDTRASLEHCAAQCSAPELLAALRQAEAALEDRRNMSAAEIAGVLAVVNAAIAKATP